MYCLRSRSDTTTLIPFVKRILECSDLLTCEIPSFDELDIPIREELQRSVCKRLLKQQLALVKEEPRKMDNQVLRRLPVEGKNLLEVAIDHGDEETVLQLLRMVTAPGLGMFSTLTTEDSEGSRLEIRGSDQAGKPYRLSRARDASSAECLLLEELEADTSNTNTSDAKGQEKSARAKAQPVSKLWLVRGHEHVYLQLMKSSDSSDILELDAPPNMRPRALAKILDLAEGLQIHSPIRHPIRLDARSLLELAAHRAESHIVQFLACNLGFAKAIPETSLSTINMTSVNDTKLASQRSALKASGMVGRKAALLHEVSPGQVKLAPGMYGDTLMPVDTAKWSGYGVAGRRGLQEARHQAGEVV